MKNKFAAFAAVLYLVLLSACKPPVEKLPNIVIIFIDDQGYADLGCYGAKGFETPNIDRLAGEGMRFTSFYVSEAVCSASRSSLMTGCYAQRIGIRGALNPIALTGLNPKEETIASLLKKKGYSTAIYGKWHLGSQKEFLPFNFGFDEYFGLPYSNDMWPVGYDGKPLEDGYKALYPDLWLIKDSVKARQISSLEHQEELTTLYTARATDFMTRNVDRPFFLYLAHSMVHVPLGVSEKFRGKSEQGMFGDVMMEVDWSVGEVLRTLKEKGLDDNTIVIYTSDNGPWLNFGNHAGSAFPLREGKGTAWEGGVRVPCVIKWPGNIKPGSIYEGLASTLDVLPTIASVVDAPLSGNKIDGVNMLPLLRGDTSHSPRNIFYYYYEGDLCAVRKGKWKLVLPHGYRSYEGVEPGRDGWPGPYARGKAGLELYDLENDVSEKNDLAAEQSDVVDELLRLAESAREALGDRLTGVTGREVRQPGRSGKVDTLVHLAKGKSISLLEEADPRYPGKGPQTLADGIRATLEFSDGNWLGFRGTDLVATIDLEEAMQISEVSVGFLQNQVSWIFLPGEVTVSVSEDGKDYKELYSKEIDNTSRDLEVKKIDFGGPAGETMRFVRVKAKSIGPCPDWHPGKGDNGWLFLDEIIVK